MAVTCPILKGPFLRFKALSWSEAESLVAGLYAIISVVCAELDIPTYVNGPPGSVDARVVLVDHDRTRRFGEDFRPVIEPNNTAIVDLATFACAYHPWNYIFSLHSEPGHQLKSLFLRLVEGQQKLLQEQLITVKSGLTMNVPAEVDVEDSALGTELYPTVCLGGTFDHLHPGHKLLLTAGAYLLDIPEKGASQTSTFIIGITGDELLKNKKDVEVLESWDQRARNVIYFLSSLLELASTGWKTTRLPDIDEKDGDFKATFRNGTVIIHCVRIQDAFGPTITEEDINVLVVSAETRSGGKAVNDKRAAQGWKELDVFEVDVLDASEISDNPTQTENFAAKISSTAIRRQIVEAGGH